VRLKEAANLVSGEAIFKLIAVIASAAITVASGAVTVWFDILICGQTWHF